MPVTPVRLHVSELRKDFEIVVSLPKVCYWCQKLEIREKGNIFERDYLLLGFIHSQKLQNICFGNQGIGVLETIEHATFCSSCIRPKNKSFGAFYGFLNVAIVICAYSTLITKAYTKKGFFQYDFQFLDQASQTGRFKKSTAGVKW